MSCVKGYSISFLCGEGIDSSSVLKQPASVEVTEISSSSDDDDLLFGMDMENLVVSTFKNEFAPSPTVDDFEFEPAEEEDVDEEVFDSNKDMSYNTPFTPAIQTPISIKNPDKHIDTNFDSSYKRLTGLNADIIRNSPLKFEKLDWY
jgi:hypothetical protein